MIGPSSDFRHLSSIDRLALLIGSLSLLPWLLIGPFLSETVYCSFVGGTISAPDNACSSMHLHLFHIHTMISGFPLLCCCSVTHAAPSNLLLLLTQMCQWLRVMHFLYLTEKLLLVHHILISVRVCVCVFCVSLCELYQIPADSLHRCLKSRVKQTIQIRPWDRSRTVLSWLAWLQFDPVWPAVSNSVLLAATVWLSRELGGTLECIFVMNILCQIVHQVDAMRPTWQSFFFREKTAIVSDAKSSFSRWLTDKRLRPFASVPPTDPCTHST